VRPRYVAIVGWVFTKANGSEARWYRWRGLSPSVQASDPLDLWQGFQSRTFSPVISVGLARLKFMALFAVALLQRTTTDLWALAFTRARLVGGCAPVGTTRRPGRHTGADSGPLSVRIQRAHPSVNRRCVEGLGLLHVSEPGSKPQSHEKEPVALLHAPPFPITKEHLTFVPNS
jgi:hypothetical protein